MTSGGCGAAWTTGSKGPAGLILAIDRFMRTRIWLVVLAVMAVAVVPAAFAFPIALAVVPIAILEPGSLLLLGIMLLTLAGVAQRVFFS